MQLEIQLHISISRLHQLMQWKKRAFADSKLCTREFLDGPNNVCRSQHVTRSIDILWAKVFAIRYGFAVGEGGGGPSDFVLEPVICLELLALRSSSAIDRKDF